MTKKELMVKAHKMTKEIKAKYPTINYKFQLCLCLSYLYKKGEKEMVELKGAEKQVRWAIDIKDSMLQNIEMMREKAGFNGRMIAESLGEEFPEIIRGDKENKALRFAIGNKYLDRAKEIIENEEMARAFINRRNLQRIDVIDILKNGRM